MKLRIYSGYFDLGDDWNGTEVDALMAFAEYYKHRKEEYKVGTHDNPPIGLNDIVLNEITPDDIKENITDDERGGWVFSILEE